MTKILGMSKEEATEVCTGLNKAMRSGKEHAYNLQYVVLPSAMEDDNIDVVLIWISRWHIVAKKPEA